MFDKNNMTWVTIDDAGLSMTCNKCDWHYEHYEVISLWENTDIVYPPRRIAYEHIVSHEKEF